MKQLSQMLVLATQRHDGQTDKGGKPYILHPLKVMHYLRSEDEELQCIALGHDLIEDTFGTAEIQIVAGKKFLEDRGFSIRVIEAIDVLTKRDGQTYEEYKTRVKSNIDAVIVKMADLRHNSDIRRLKGVTQKDIERIEKYHKFYLELGAMVTKI